MLFVRIQSIKMTYYSSCHFLSYLTFYKFLSFSQLVHDLVASKNQKSVKKLNKETFHAVQVLVNCREVVRSENLFRTQKSILKWYSVHASILLFLIFLRVLQMLTVFRWWLNSKMTQFIPISFVSAYTQGQLTICIVFAFQRKQIECLCIETQFFRGLKVTNVGFIHNWCNSFIKFSRKQYVSIHWTVKMSTITAEAMLLKLSNVFAR